MERQRHVSVREPESGTQFHVSRLDEDGTRVIERLDGYECLELYRKAQAKANSISRKRPIGQSMDEEDELEDGYSDEDDDEWKTRGRKRTRCSYGTPSGEELDRTGSEVSESADAAALASLRTSWSG